MISSTQIYNFSYKSFSRCLCVSHLVLHLVMKSQVLLHLCPKGGSVSTERTDHVAPLPLLTVLDVVPQRGSTLVHHLAERTGLLAPPCI